MSDEVIRSTAQLFVDLDKMGQGLVRAEFDDKRLNEWELLGFAA